MPTKGLEELLASLDATTAAIVSQTGDAMQNGGIVTEAVTKQHTPVRTGRLRAGNQYVATGPLSCVVGNAVNYALDVELGTHKMAPRPFLFPGYQAGKAAIKADLAKIPGVKITSWS